jgi:hypothetical protein
MRTGSQSGEALTDSEYSRTTTEVRIPSGYPARRPGRICPFLRADFSQEVFPEFFMGEILTRIPEGPRS